MPSSSTETADTAARGGTVPSGPSRHHGRGNRAQRRPGRRSGWLPLAYLLPAFAVYAAFLLYPLIRSAQFSLYEYDGATLGTFVGLANYADVLGDPDLRASFGHALVLIGFYAVLPVLLGLPLAALLTRAKVRGLAFFRTVVFLPQVVAMVVVAVAWRRIYDPDGPLNGALRAIGLDGLTRGWLGDYTLALPAVGLIGTWVQLGLVTVLLMAGMSRIPSERYEAARLDGASPAREFFAVTLPAVRGEVAVALTLTIIAALKTFDLIYVTTSGGPGNSTSVPSYEVYRRAFELGEVGSATAVAVVLTALIFLISLGVNRIADRESGSE
ncbi:carbohydrate ABC transporter permease [Plantactinospora sp. GCM10030261]|uniref:carbohydrate ABC transporter permease n=1 Tax=Plantactinospora sp. GCM10030261 TaxID=3273420 RepID=UPI0036189499